MYTLEGKCSNNVNADIKNIVPIMGEVEEKREILNAGLKKNHEVCI